MGGLLHVDHVVPVVAGGTTSEDKLLTACEECNLGRGIRALVRAGHERPGAANRLTAVRRPVDSGKR